jgi:hypothetical protein
MKKNIIFLLIFSVLVSTAQNGEKVAARTTSKSSVENSNKQMADSSLSKSPSKSMAVIHSYVSKTATTVEAGNFLTSMNGKNYYSNYARLAITFNLSKSFYFGPYCTSNIFTTDENLQVTSNNNNYLLKTTRLVNTGLVFGVNFFSGKKVQLVPEVRIGWNFLNMQGLNFDNNKKDFLDQQFVGVNPVLNLGFRVSDYTVLGINSGYTVPLYIKGQKIDGYDLQTINMGAFVRFRLSK